MSRRAKAKVLPIVRMYSWRPDRRAIRNHIREAIRYALWEKRVIGGKSDAWYAAASDYSREWRDKVRATSLRTLARQYLEYWRHRAFLRWGAFGNNETDPVFAEKWRAHGVGVKRDAGNDLEAREGYAFFRVLTNTIAVEYMLPMRANKLRGQNLAKWQELQALAAQHDARIRDSHVRRY